MSLKASLSHRGSSRILEGGKKGRKGEEKRGNEIMRSQSESFPLPWLSHASNKIASFVFCRGK